MRTVLSFVIFIVLVASCEVKSNKINAISEINVSGIEKFKMDTRYLSEFSNEFEYIRPEAKLGSFFSQMGISYIGSKFVILFEKKTSQLFVFYRDGKFLGKLGEIGRGPNEYITLPRVFVFSSLEEIHVYDFKRAQILRFDYNLNFKGKTKINAVPSAIHKYMDKFYICSYNGEELKENGGKILVARDPVSFREQNVLFKINNNNYTKPIEIRGLDTNWFFHKNDTLCFAMQTSKGVSIYNVIDNNVKQIHELTFESDNNERIDKIPDIIISNLMYFYDYLVISYQHDLQIYTGFYNSKTKKLSRFNIANDLDKGLDFNPIGNCEDGGYYSDDLKIGYFNDFWKTNESNTTYKKLKSKFPERENWLKQTISQSQEENPWIMVIK